MYNQDKLTGDLFFNVRGTVYGFRNAEGIGAGAETEVVKRPEPWYIAPAMGP